MTWRSRASPAAIPLERAFRPGDFFPDVNAPLSHIAKRIYLLSPNVSFRLHIDKELSSLLLSLQGRMKKHRKHIEEQAAFHLSAVGAGA